jgi:hypothetical protein
MALGLMDGGDTEDGEVVKGNPKPKQCAKVITDKGKKCDCSKRQAPTHPTGQVTPYPRS